MVRMKTTDTRNMSKEEWKWLKSTNEPGKESVILLVLPNKRSTEIV